jgi:hypothetical protein
MTVLRHWLGAAFWEAQPDWNAAAAHKDQSWASPLDAAGGMAEVIESLPNKRKAMRSNPNTTPHLQKKKQEIQIAHFQGCHNSWKPHSQ